MAFALNFLNTYLFHVELSAWRGLIASQLKYFSNNLLAYDQSGVFS